jgi:hypothetical protein
MAPSGSSSPLLARETAALTHEGLSPARASEAIEVQSEIAQTDVVRKLIAATGGAYGGGWFVSTGAQMHIGVTSRASRQAAERIVAHEGLTGDVMITPVHSSWAELLATQKRWNSKLAYLFARAEVKTALTPQLNAVAVTLSSSVSQGERVVLEHEAAASTVNVLVMRVPYSQLRAIPDAETKCNLFAAEKKAYCDKPITAGVKIRSQGRVGWLCTAGPLAVPVVNKSRTYVLTAGHCIKNGGRGAKWYAWNTAVGGAMKEIGQAARQYVDGLAGDAGAINVNMAGAWAEPLPTPVFAVTAEWKKAEEKSFPVKGQRTPMVGLANCVEGQISGGTCGTVKEVSVSIAGSDGLVEDEGEAISAEGDSGGPVIAETKGEYLVEGIDVNHNRATNNAIYEPLETALSLLNALKLELLTTANEVRPAEGGKEKEEDEKDEKEEKEEAEELEKEEKEEVEKEEKEEKERHFAGTSKSGTLKAGADTVVCAKDTSIGELTSTMLFGAVVIHLLECRSTSNGTTFCTIKSTNTTNEGLILTNTLHAILGLVLPSRAGGLVLLPASGKTWTTLAANSCTPESKVTGTVAGLITPTGKSETTSKVSFSTSSGKQEIKDIDTLAGFIEPELTAFSFSATEEAAEEITWGKAIEVP